MHEHNRVIASWLPVAYAMFKSVHCSRAPTQTDRCLFVTGLRVLSYMFIVAGTGAVMVVGLNALGMEPMGEKQAPYIEPGMVRHPI